MNACFHVLSQLACVLKSACIRAHMLTRNAGMLSILIDQCRMSWSQFARVFAGINSVPGGRKMRTLSGLGEGGRVLPCICSIARCALSLLSYCTNPWHRLRPSSRITIFLAPKCESQTHASKPPSIASHTCIIDISNQSRLEALKKIETVSCLCNINRGPNHSVMSLQAHPPGIAARHQSHMH